LSDKPTQQSGGVEAAPTTAEAAAEAEAKPEVNVPLKIDTTPEVVAKPAASPKVSSAPSFFSVASLISPNFGPNSSKDSDKEQPVKNSSPPVPLKKRCLAEASSPETDVKKAKMDDAVASGGAVGEAVEEPTMEVKGRGSGADCEAANSEIIGEEISEDVFYVVGRGSGVDCDARNTKVDEASNGVKTDGGDKKSTTKAKTGDNVINVFFLRR